MMRQSRNFKFQISEFQIVGTHRVRPFLALCAIFVFLCFLVTLWICFQPLRKTIVFLVPLQRGQARTQVGSVLSPFQGEYLPNGRGRVGK